MKNLKKIILIGVLMMSQNGFTKTVWKGRAILIVKKDKIEAFKSAVEKIIQPTLKEKGCISYEGYQVIDEEGKETNRFVFHELWVNKETMLVDHQENAPHMKNFFQKIKINTPNTFLESFEVTGEEVKVLGE